MRVSEIISPVIDDGGNIIGTAAIARDTSTRQRAEEEIKALHEINLPVTLSLDLGTILDNLLEQVDKIFPYAISHIRLVNDITGELEPVACHNLDEAIWKSEPSAGRDNSIHKIILDTKKPAVVRDIRTDERIAPDGFWVDRGIISYIGVPMIFKEEGIGVLALFSKEEHAYSEDDVRFLVAVANQASIAIRNSQLYETSKTQNQALEASRQEIRSLILNPLMARDEEAKRIAEVLHDDSSQLVVAIRLALDDLENRPTAAMIAGLQPIKDMLGQVEDRLRNLSHELHPAILDIMGLQPSLDFLAEQVAHRTGIHVSVDAARDGRLAPALELCFYRVAQEALANITRHAQARHVAIQLGENDGLVQCRIQDDGIGFDPNAMIAGQFIHNSRGGLGLTLARARIEALGGTLTLESVPGTGTRIQISIPKEKNNG